MSLRRTLFITLLLLGWLVISAIAVCSAVAASPQARRSEMIGTDLESRRLNLLSLLLVSQLAEAAEAAGASSQTASGSYKPEQLEQLVAPIALYPDSLLAQILMASTYPLEVVQAARWAKDNPNVRGKSLETAMQAQSWDPSVKSLTAVPQVLTMMNDKLDWTQQLGDAFLSDQKAVLDAAQRLRAKAEANGSLKDTKEQKVSSTTAAAPVSGGSTTQYITIESSDPEVVYVPSYDPAVAYGSWPYPAYPPYTYYPPGYVAGTALLSFGVGLAVGGALWGNCNWGGGDVNINTNRYNSFNQTNVRNQNWKHNADHRRNVPYGNQNLSQKFGGKRDAAARDARNQFRGRSDLDRSGFGDRERGRTDRPGLDRGNRGDFGGRDGGFNRDRSGSGFGNRDRGSAFSGAGRGAETRQFSQRGGSSMRSSGGGGGGRSFSGGGGRGGGGGMRGGGGRRR